MPTAVLHTRHWETDLQVLTMRAARGLLANKLTTPEAISEAPLEEEVEALHSEGNVQRGESSACAAVCA